MLKKHMSSSGSINGVVCARDDGAECPEDMGINRLDSINGEGVGVGDGKPKLAS